MDYANKRLFYRSKVHLVGHTVNSSSSRSSAFSTSLSDRITSTTGANNMTNSDTSKHLSQNQNPPPSTPVAGENDEKSSRRKDKEDSENKNVFSNNAREGGDVDSNSAEFIMEMEVDEDISFKPLATLKEKQVRKSSRIARTDISTSSNATNSSASRLVASVESKANASRDPSPLTSTTGREGIKEPIVAQTSAVKRASTRTSNIPRSSFGGGGTKIESNSPASRSDRERAMSVTSSSSVAMRTKDALARHKDRMMKRQSTSS